MCDELHIKASTGISAEITAGEIVRVARETQVTPRDRNLKRAELIRAEARVSPQFGV